MVAEVTGGDRLARGTGRTAQPSDRGTNGAARVTTARVTTARVTTAIVALVALVVLGASLASCSSRPPTDPAGAAPTTTTATPSTTAAPPSTTSTVPSSPVSTLQGAVASGRFVRAVRVGGLQIVPDTGEHGTAPLGMDLATATTYAGYTDGLATPSSSHLAAGDLVGFGRVTLGGVTLPAGIPRLSATPAWVAVAPPPTGAVNCPAMRPSSAGATTTTSPYHHGVYRAAVFFGSVAQGGTGAVFYVSGGSDPCGGSSGPSAKAAAADVPVAWQVTGTVGSTTTVRYQAPVCAHPGNSSAGGNLKTGIITVSVSVHVPFDRTGCAGVRSLTQSVTLFPTSPPGAPAPPSHITLHHAVVPSVPPALLGPLGGH